MHVGTKQLSLLSILLAFCVILIVLSGVIETSTLFLIAAASFFVGIAFRESNKVLGIGFYLAAILLSLILAPNKLYCFTFAMISLYIVLRELFREKLFLCQTSGRQNPKYYVAWILRFLMFNLIYLPILIFLPSVVIAAELTTKLFLAFLAGGQIVFYLYDRAYDYFILNYWMKLKNRIMR